MQVMEKVLKMAEGIDIGEMRSYELVPGKRLKRQHSSSDGEYICPCVKGDLPSLSLLGGHWWECGESRVPWGHLQDSQHSRLKRSDHNVSPPLPCCGV